MRILACATDWCHFAWMLRSPQWVAFFEPQEWAEAVRELRRMTRTIEIEGHPV